VAKYDLDLAVEQVAETIRRHLIEVLPDGVAPVIGLTEPLVLNLARHIVMLRMEYGKLDEPEDPHEYEPDEEHAGCAVCGHGVCHYLHVESET